MMSIDSLDRLRLVRVYVGFSYVILRLILMSIYATNNRERMSKHSMPIQFSRPRRGNDFHSVNIGCSIKMTPFASVLQPKQ
jgi:hypothetical protein